MGSLGGHDVGSATFAGIDQSVATELVECFGIKFTSAALNIGAVGASRLQSTLIPVKTEPEKVILYLAGIFEARALRIEVLYTQNPAAATTFYREP